MKLLIDMNLSPLWVSYLAAAGFASVHWSQNVLPSQIGQIVVRALNASRSFLESGALVTVDPFRHRIRLLPL
jgi:predicted nuclease of predicted toxin-antitoxin system